jgi:hypothetical protein
VARDDRASTARRTSIAQRRQGQGQRYRHRAVRRRRAHSSVNARAGEGAGGGASQHLLPSRHGWRNPLDLAVSGLEECGRGKRPEREGVEEPAAVFFARRCRSLPSPVDHRPRRSARRRVVCARDAVEKEKWARVTRGRRPQVGFAHAIWADDRPILIRCDQRLLAVDAWMGQSRPRRDKARRPLRRPAGLLLGRGPKRVRGKRQWAAFSRGPKRKVLHSMFCKLF